MKRLIVNADDFGFTPGVNAGVLRAHQQGILTSATLMANGAAFDEAVSLARANPKLGVGIHMVAVGGLPVAPAGEISTLVDAGGRLLPTLTALIRRMALGRVRLEHLEREFAAQIEKVRAAGIAPTHLDSHKHSHTQPLVMRAMARAAVDHGIKVIRNPFDNLRKARPIGLAARRRTAVYWRQFALAAVVAPRERTFRRIAREHGLRAPDAFRGVALTGLLDGEALVALIGSLEEGTTELMCHPAVVDQALAGAATRLKRERQGELDALLDAGVRGALERYEVQLISFREFSENV